MVIKINSKIKNNEEKVKAEEDLLLLLEPMLKDRFYVYYKNYFK